MNAPRATYRLQFNKDFTFADAHRLVPYLTQLGISHIYASPITTARQGSMHGYDVVDPTTISVELGGENGLKELVAELRRNDLGLIVDIVPNHMATDAANAWWMDVLAHGRHSRYAKYFDIDWDPPVRSLKDKVLLPILGRPYGEALSAGELKLAQGHSGYVLSYFDNELPIASNPGTLEIDEFDSASQEGRRRLHHLLEQQHYRLAWWRAANDLINWRRFFDINELIAVRVEDDEVFAALHSTVFRLYAEGIIDGFRIDHIDGLKQPGPYCRKLREQLGTLQSQRPQSCSNGQAYFVVEKILADDERLPKDWRTDGTTGYDFMAHIGALFHESKGEQVLSQQWQHISGRSGDFNVEEQLARRQILKRSFSAQFQSLIEAISSLAQAAIDTRDYSSAVIARCITEILTHFPVYRIYAQVSTASEADRIFLSRAIADATTTGLPTDKWLLPILERWLSGQQIDQKLDSSQNKALSRFQQLSAPLSAKAVEDTAFYRYGRLLSRNDVGFDPRVFSVSLEEFHADMRARFEDYPNAMLATATHDHKRGEDMRARLAVLSEIPGDWSAAVDRWLGKTTGRFAAETSAPLPGDKAILVQTIVGAWPLTLTPSDPSGLRTYRERLSLWQQKALREAKLRSDWSEPDAAYEQAAEDFLCWLFSDPVVLGEMYAFVERIAAPGAINGLSQTLLKLTAPGVPDFYQGTEYWDLSLVDPDNRAPVDFAARQNVLDCLTEQDILPTWRSGVIKQALIARVLAARRTAGRQFAKANYVRLRTEGPLGNNFIAFARVVANQTYIAIAPRFMVRHITNTKTLSIDSEQLRATRLLVPDTLSGRYRSATSGTDIAVANGIPVNSLLQNWPVGFLARFDEAIDV
jgi:(1->4)-alpha-D-glucan 1-alpha-D-glucosylmutase